jgi:hypothetical protein
MFALKVFLGFKESTKNGGHDYQGEKTLVLVFSKLGTWYTYLFCEQKTNHVEV